MRSSWAKVIQTELNRILGIVPDNKMHGYSAAVLPDHGRHRQVVKCAAREGLHNAFQPIMFRNEKRIAYTALCIHAYGKVYTGGC